MAIVLGLLLLGGCAPIMQLAEVRALAPSRSVTLSGDYRDLAECALDAFQLDTRTDAFGDVRPGDLSYSLAHRRDLGRASVTGFLPTEALPLVDFVFARVDAGVLVQSRLGHYRASADGADAVLAGARGVEARAWSLIERCAKGQS